MPYIKERERELLAKGHLAKDAGELNYKITKLVDEYIARKGLSYKNINEVIGVLECAKLELYRRVASPYENVKFNDNGDVYSKKNLAYNDRKGIPINPVLKFGD